MSTKRSPFIPHFTALLLLLVLPFAVQPGAAAAAPLLDDDADPPLIFIDLTPAQPNGYNGWYWSPVTLQPHAIDDSDVAQLRCVLDPAGVPTTYADLPATVCPFLDGAQVTADGAHSFYAAAMDIFNNQSAVVSVSFQIDATAPKISCPAGGPFLLGTGEHAIGPAGVDASVSGLDEAGSNLTGVLTTESVGLKTVTFTAFDLAGNSASEPCTYNVIFDFGGLYAPVKPAPALNPVSAGSVIPVKFSLGGFQGLGILAAGSPVTKQVSCTTLESLSAGVATKPTGKSMLSYDPLTGRYLYGWKTSKAWAGTCRALIVQLSDGTEHLAYFKFQ